MADKKEITASSVLNDFKDAKDYKRKWIKQAKEDYSFLVGDQWDQDDLDKLKAAGKPSLVLNKIQSLIFLISGIQRQNRTDAKAFPIGEEDTIKAESITMLIKDMVRNCDGDYKESEMFENGIICGEGWIEPYQDYSKDIVNGDMMFRDCSPLNVFPDPASKEYDHSDARFIIKYTPNISEEQLLVLFPESEDKIRSIQGKILGHQMDDDSSVIIKYANNDYPGVGEENESDSKAEILDYDMIEYHYYRQRPVYVIANAENKDDYTVFDKESDADEVLELRLEQGLYSKLKRFIKVPYIKVLVNGEEIDDYENPFYPRYRKITLFSFYAHKTKAPIKRSELLVQGIVNSLKDPQREINKRRSQELHHLNTSTNSGWLNKKRGGFSNREEVEELGSTAGIILDYDNDKPEQIHPMTLSSGHEQLVQLANKDIKEISGINTDLLAMNDKASSSGRAIHLRQQQGLMMIMRILDNFSRTKREIGRFLISQIGEVFTPAKAKRAIGEAWIKEHFSVPVMTIRKNPHTGEPVVDPQTGSPEQVPMMKPDGEMITELDEQAVEGFLTMILQDSSVDRYDVAIGEIATSETIKMANYATLLELTQSGIPIPPEVIVDESMMSQASKNKIMKSIARSQMAAQQAG